jgi:hypothetical protein
MEEKQISGQEGLAIIQQMINTAKKEQKDNGMGWIIWGWLLFLASVFTYINLKTRWLPTFMFWNIAGGLTLLALLYEVVRDNFLRKKKEKVRTYMKDLFEKLNVGFFIQIFFVILAMNMGVGATKGFALLIGTYGFWILIYGATLNFRPSIVGAFVTWAIGIAALFAESFGQTMILHAAAILFGYIIPGHIAYKEFKKLSTR